MNLKLAVSRWSAWAPGLDTAEQWLAWARDAHVPEGDDQPALAEMAPLMRRRLTRLGRIALQASWACQIDDTGIPTVFASRYGDVGRSLSLLGDLARDGVVSPTGFTQSVHNAIGAMYAIARIDCSNALCVAAGRTSAAAGLIEAAGLLRDGAKQVLVVCYDEALPADYAEFRDEPPCVWAWAWLVTHPSAGAHQISLAVDASSQYSEATPALPASLEVLRHFLDGSGVLVQHMDGRRWEWQRNA